MKEHQFNLSHVVLYAKHWYLRSDDVFEDLIKILKLDDYTPFDRADVLSILLNNFQKFDHRSTELREFAFGVAPSQCWKYGYYTKETGFGYTSSDKQHLPEYNYETAVVKYILSSLMTLDNKQWNVVTPKFTKYPRSKDVTIRKVYEQFVLPNPY